MDNQQLKTLHRLFSEVDNLCILADYNTKFYGAGAADSRQLLYFKAIHQSCHEKLNTRDCYTADSLMTPSVEELDKLFTKNQNFCWSSHAHHFHTNFIQYLCCPVTCLYEIVEFLEKLQKENKL